jgi:hypothetical protein
VAEQLLASQVVLSSIALGSKLVIHELYVEKSPLNLVTNPNPVYSHSYTGQLMPTKKN